jgi:hypothetical protein
VYSFHDLFSCYAKYLGRFFATTSDPRWSASEFHELLYEGINYVTQERYHSPSSDHSLNGEQLEALLSALHTAEHECEAEHTLRNTLHRFNAPSRTFSPDPEDFPEEYKIYKQCCPLASQEAED